MRDFVVDVAEELPVRGDARALADLHGPTWADPQWANLNFSIAGLWEITPHALAEVATKVQVVDVREPAEFAHGLGHIDGALLVPLGELQARLDELPRDRPLVAVCRSGARSARATAMLAKAGFPSRKAIF